MFLLQTVSPESATGDVAKLYAAFPPEIGVPQTLQLMSASPGLMERHLQVIDYFRNHKRLSPEFFTALRYSVAAKVGHKACEVFNRGILSRMGLEDERIHRLECDPTAAGLDKEEERLLAFVHQVTDDPASVTAKEVEALRTLGFSDSDILDACSAAANMVASSVLFKAFIR